MNVIAHDELWELQGNGVMTWLERKSELKSL